MTIHYLTISFQRNDKVDCTENIVKNIDYIDSISFEVKVFPDILPYDRNERKEVKRKIINSWKYFVVDGKNVVGCWDIDFMVKNQTYYLYLDFNRLDKKGHFIYMFCVTQWFFFLIPLDVTAGSVD
jgi:hypothetical protein